MVWSNEQLVIEVGEAGEVRESAGGPSRGAAPALAAVFPAVNARWSRLPPDGPALPRVEAASWSTGAIDAWAFDRWGDEVAAKGALAIAVVGERAGCEQAAVEVLTRLQRVFPRRNAASASAAFSRLLLVHRSRHELSRPLVRADYDHAVDAWQWALRLEPGASAAVQMAALVHDIERLSSEPDRRIEHLAPDYEAFKARHARGGASMALSLLREAGVDDLTSSRVGELVARHERPDGDAELALLNDADALSFFSLNSHTYLAYFGDAQTEKKVAYTLGRLSPGSLRHLEHIRLHPDVDAMVRDVLGERRLVS